MSNQYRGRVDNFCLRLAPLIRETIRTALASIPDPPTAAAIDGARASIIAAIDALPDAHRAACWEAIAFALGAAGDETIRAVFTQPQVDRAAT